MHFDYNISFIVLKLIGRKAKPFKYLKGQKTTTTKICKDKLLLSIDKLLLSIDKTSLKIPKRLLEAVNRRKADIMATEKTNKDLQKTNDWAA
jgi:hypothetical protein